MSQYLCRICKKEDLLLFEGECTWCSYTTIYDRGGRYRTFSLPTRQNTKLKQLKAKILGEKT